MPGDEPPRGGVAWCSYPHFDVAIPLEAVLRVERRLPPAAAPAAAWWQDAGPEGGRFLALRANGGEAWMAVGHALEMVQPERFERLPLPSLVAEHLLALGVAGLVRRDEGLAYLLSPERIIGGER